MLWHALLSLLGLPLTPASIRIIGRFQKLKALDHVFLCKYLDIIRGKYGKWILVNIILMNFRWLPVLFRTDVYYQWTSQSRSARFPSAAACRKVRGFSYSQFWVWEHEHSPVRIMGGQEDPFGGGDLPMPPWCTSSGIWWWKPWLCPPVPGCDQALPFQISLTSSISLPADVRFEFPSSAKHYQSIRLRWEY